MKNIKLKKKIKILCLFISCIIVLSCVNINIISASDLRVDPDKCECCEVCECCETCMVHEGCDADVTCMICEDCCCKNAEVFNTFEESEELKVSRETKQTSEQQNPGITLVYPELGRQSGRLRTGDLFT